MNERIKIKWVESLRSGEYQQGEGALKDRDGNFCCLGVLEDLFMQEQGGEWSDKPIRLASPAGSFRAVGYQPSTADDKMSSTSLQVLSKACTEWAGLGDNNPEVEYVDGDEVRETNCLADFNDQGLSFDVLADLIKNQL